MGITGEWSGIYSYSGQMGHMAPTRFQASFSPADAQGNFVGHITDADNMGEAVVTGTQTGINVQFIKTYRKTRYKHTLPIFYQGIFSEDGQRLHGNWHIERKFLGLSLGKAEGSWGAQRPDLPEIMLVWPPPPQEPDA